MRDLNESEVRLIIVTYLVGQLVNAPGTVDAKVDAAFEYAERIFAMNTMWAGQPAPRKVDQP